MQKETSSRENLKYFSKPDFKITFYQQNHYLDVLSSTT